MFIPVIPGLPSVLNSSLGKLLSKLLTLGLAAKLALLHSSGLDSDLVTGAMEWQAGAKSIAVYHLPSWISCSLLCPCYKFPPPPPPRLLAIWPSGSQLLSLLACCHYFCSIDTPVYGQIGLSESIITTVEETNSWSRALPMSLDKIKESFSVPSQWLTRSVSFSPKKDNPW